MLLLFVILGISSLHLNGIKKVIGYKKYNISQFFWR